MINILSKCVFPFLLKGASSSRELIAFLPNGLLSFKHSISFSSALSFTEGGSCLMSSFEITNKGTEASWHLRLLRTENSSRATFSLSLI